MMDIFFDDMTTEDKKNDGGNDSSGGKDTETALDILKKHYVKGEIPKDEFEQMKKDISS